MKPLKTVVNVSVIVGSCVVGYGAYKTITAGLKVKKGMVVAGGVLAALIAIYAFTEASDKLRYS